jgi:hypothetical protein
VADEFEPVLQILHLPGDADLGVSDNWVAFHSIDNFFHLVCGFGRKGLDKQLEMTDFFFVAAKFASDLLDVFDDEEGVLVVCEDGVADRAGLAEVLPAAQDVVGFVYFEGEFGDFREDEGTLESLKVEGSHLLQLKLDFS